MKLNELNVTSKVTLGLFCCFCSAIYVPIKAMEPSSPPAITTDQSLPYDVEMGPVPQTASAPLRKKLARLLFFIKHNKRTTAKTVIWEGIFAAGLSILTFEVATSFDVDPGMAVAAAYINQAMEAPFYWSYEYLWKKYCPSKLVNKSTTISHIDQAADGPGGTLVLPHDLNPADRV